MLNNKSILITGGTGSFGKIFIKMIFENFKPHKVIVYSRDEMKQWNMVNKFKSIDSDNKIKYIIGDVRDKERLHRSCQHVDYLIHAAATKIVPTAEYNPFEAIKTNIFGAMNVIEVAIEQNVKGVVALSTDKACNPINLYGATKLASDKLFASANLDVGNRRTRFSVVRYGNVMGSRGSVIPFFQSQVDRGTLTITDERMTRFMITLEQGVHLVWHALSDMVGGELYVHKIPSMKIIDIANAIAPDAYKDVIGIRPGEKIHEVMVSEEDSYSTYEYDWYYKIIPTLNHWHLDSERIKDGEKLANGFVYSSGNNHEWMTIRQLQEYLKSPEYIELQSFNG